MKHTINTSFGKNITKDSAKTGYAEVMKALDGMANSEPSEKELDEFLLEHATGDEFASAVYRYADIKNYTLPTVYKQGNLSRQYFWDVINKKTAVKKPVVFNIAIGLRLDCRETVDLLNSAGFSFNEKKQFDSIIMYCIAHKTYDIYAINDILYDHGEETLKTTADNAIDGGSISNSIDDDDGNEK